jgi:hypothetical protein
MSGIARDFVELIDRFLSGADTSLAAAREMEALLLDNFTHEAWFNDASIALAQYSPAGGNHMYGVSDLAEVLRRVKADLEADLGGF